MYTELMLLTFHILAAISSVFIAGAAYITPTQVKLRAAYAMSAAMLLSGTYLVVHNTAHLLEACVMGLLFLAVVSFELVAARNKLAREHIAKN